MAEEQIEQKAEEYASSDKDKIDIIRTVKDWHLRKNGFLAGYLECQKANEWQYVSEKGTPQKEGHYLVCLRNKDRDIFDCWIYYDKDVGWYSMKVRIKDIYAWKELVPPSEPMRSLDKEEQKNYTEAINKVYKPTGVRLFDKESE